MCDPQTIWLILSNILLGALVLALLLGVLTGVLCDVIQRVRKRHSMWNELDRDMRELFRDSHTKQ